MAWSKINMNWDGDQSNYHKHHMTGLSQAQAHPFPHMSPSHDWRWSGDARASTSNWNAASSSHATPSVSGDFHWNAPSPTKAVNATSTIFDNPTPSPSLNYSPETTPTFFSHVDRISPGSQSADFPDQASQEEDTCNNEVYNRALSHQPHDRLQTTRKRSRISQRYVISYVYYFLDSLDTCLDNAICINV